MHVSNEGSLPFTHYISHYSLCSFVHYINRAELKMFHLMSPPTSSSMPARDFRQQKIENCHFSNENIFVYCEKQQQ